MLRTSTRPAPTAGGVITSLETRTLQRFLPVCASSATTSPSSFATATVRPSVPTPAERGISRLTLHSVRSEEHTSELQSHVNLVCRLLLEKKKTKKKNTNYTVKNVS